MRSVGSVLPVPAPHSPEVAQFKVMVGLGWLLLFIGFAKVPPPPVRLFQYAWRWNPVMSCGNMSVGAPFAPEPLQLMPMLSVTDGVKMLSITSSLTWRP